MIVTKEVFDQIAPGEIFRTVTTRLQTVYDPFNTILKFVCVKGKKGIDWAIYAGDKSSQDNDLARYGDKVMNESNIRALCPCDDAVFQLYRK